MFDELLTIDELAARYKVPKTWIYARTRETGPEAMPRVKVGKYLRFDPCDTDNFIKKNFGNSISSDDSKQCGKKTA